MVDTSKKAQQDQIIFRKSPLVRKSACCKILFGSIEGRVGVGFSRGCLSVVLFILLFAAVSGSVSKAQSVRTDNNVPVYEPVRTGSDVLLSDSASLLKNKRIGLVCNAASVLSDGRHIIDGLREIPSAKLTALFAPEHGFSGKLSAGQVVKTERLAGIPVYSLYSDVKKPTAKMLQEVDVLVFDLQDAGARFYTFLSTLAFCIEAAAENGVPILILDRPNPLGGVTVEGPILSENMKSFVGMLPVPIRHGMTLGELATMMVDEKWIVLPKAPDMRVIPMTGWKRSMWFDQTGLKWIAPSPNLPTLETVIAYPGSCFLEGTNISEGRGTDTPFLLIGAPFIEPHDFSVQLNAARLKGVMFFSEKFTPKVGTGETKVKFDGEECYGVRLLVSDRELFQPVRFGITLLSVLSGVCGDKFRMMPYFDKLVGLPDLRSKIRDAKESAKLLDGWDKEAALFQAKRGRYLLYR